MGWKRKKLLDRWLSGYWQVRSRSRLESAALSRYSPVCPAVPCSALKMWNYYKKGNSICDNTVIRGAAYALSCLEVNASMGLIVAAPTAGACGILPGALLTVAEKYDVDHQRVLDALATASGIGQLIIKKATVSGAEGGCQAECGSAAAMAAAAITDGRARRG
jgi:L-serine dehydratase